MKSIDLAGQKVGRLLVIEKSHLKGNRNQIKWRCLCDCGKEHHVMASALSKQRILSCGCFRQDPSYKTKSKIHGKSNTRLYRIYRHMRNRCENKNVDSYYLYGGRGLSVCDEWKDSSAFIEWAEANGYRDDLTLDRKDNNAGYFPENCRWVTPIEQARNKRSAKLSEEIATQIRAMKSNGARVKDIAKQFDVSASLVCDVVYERIWKTCNNKAP